MKKQLAVLAAAISLTCASAYAQTTPAAPAADPAAEAAARELLAASKSRELMVLSLQQAEQQFPGQIQAMVAQAMEADKSLTPQQKEQAMAQVAKALPGMTAKLHDLLSDPKLVDQMLAETVPLYAQTYSVDELHGLTAFYRSPLGQKMLANTPKLIAASAEISNRIMMPRFQQLMTEVVKQFAPK